MIATTPIRFAQSIPFSGTPEEKKWKTEPDPSSSQKRPSAFPKGYVRFAGGQTEMEEQEHLAAAGKPLGKQKKEPKSIDYHVYNRKNTISPLATYHTLVKSDAHKYHVRNGEVLEKQVSGTGEYPHTHWLQNKKKNKVGQIPYVVFDTETTGIKKYDRIIQLAFSHVREDHRVTHLGDHNLLIHPGTLDDGSMFPIQPGAQATHGITPTMLEDAPRMNDILRPILKEQIGENSLLVAYNAKFDVGMINEAINRINKMRKGQAPLRPMDTALVLDPFVLLQRIHPFNALSRKLTNHYEILMGADLENAHDAQADVDATVDVLKYCLKYLEKHQIPLEWAKYAESCLPRNRKIDPQTKAANIAEVVRNNRELFEEMMPIEEVEPLEIADVLRFQHGSPVYHQGKDSGLPKLDISLSIFGWDGTKEWDGSDELDREVVTAIRRERNDENRDYLIHKFGDDIPSTHLIEAITCLRKAVQPVKGMDSADIERDMFEDLRMVLGTFLTDKFLLQQIPTADAPKAEHTAFKKELKKAVKFYLDKTIEQRGEKGSTYRLYHNFLPKMTDHINDHVQHVMAEIGDRYFYTEIPVEDGEKLIDPGIITQLEVEARKPRRSAKVQVSRGVQRKGKVIRDDQGEPIEKGLLIKEEWLNKIFDGDKTWEIRRGPVNIRGTIALIQSGTGMVYGTAEVVDSVGPLSMDEMVVGNADKHQIPPEDIKANGLPYGKHTYAWVLDNVKRFDKPVPYDHPPGAVKWVTLPTQEGPSPRRKKTTKAKIETKD